MARDILETSEQRRGRSVETDVRKVPVDEKVGQRKDV
jgi:hypothetical protein